MVWMEKRVSGTVDRLNHPTIIKRISLIKNQSFPFLWLKLMPLKRKIILDTRDLFV